MEIGKIDFDTMESVRKKCITFAKDGNTVVKPYKTLYNMENVTHDTTHKNLYLEIVKESYRDDICCDLWEDIGIICYKVGYIDGCCKLDEIVGNISKYPYLGIDGFYKQLEESEQNGYYINKVDIEVCAMFGNVELANHYVKYRERQIATKEAEQQAELEERKRKESEEQEKRLTEIEKAIADTEYKIFHKKDFKNTEVDGKSVINQLMGKYGIKVPLRTQGWINSKLAMIIFTGGEISYRFYGKSQRDNSTVFRKYLVKLENAINDELAVPFC